MLALIGTGSHASDIANSIAIGRQFSHHKEWDGTKPVIIGISDPWVRYDIAQELAVCDRNWVHPNAYLDRCVLGYSIHVNYGVMATRAQFGNYVTVAPGVHMAGDIVIGDRVFVGIGANIGHLVTIGNDVSIGAGSTVLYDVPDGTKVRGFWKPS